MTVRSGRGSNQYQSKPGGVPTIAPSRVGRQHVAAAVEELDPEEMADIEWAFSDPDTRADRLRATKVQAWGDATAQSAVAVEAALPENRERAPDDDIYLMVTLRMSVNDPEMVEAFGTDTLIGECELHIEKPDFAHLADLTEDEQREAAVAAAAHMAVEDRFDNDPATGAWDDASWASWEHRHDWQFSVSYTDSQNGQTSAWMTVAPIDVWARGPYGKSRVDARRRPSTPQDIAAAKAWWDAPAV